MGEPSGLDHRSFVGNRKRDVLNFAGRRVDSMQGSAGPKHDRARVGRPSHRWIHPVDRPRLLHVAVEIVVDASLGSRLQIQHEQRGAQADAPNVRQRLPVGGGGGARGASRAPDDGLDTTFLSVEASDGIDASVGILVVLEVFARRAVPAEVQVATVGRKGRLAHVLLVVGLLGHPQAFASADVVQPHLAAAQAAGLREVLARGDVLPVGGPGGRVE